MMLMLAATPEVLIFLSRVFGAPHLFVMTPCDLIVVILGEVCIILFLAVMLGPHRVSMTGDNRGPFRFAIGVIQ